MLSKEAGKKEFALGNEAIVRGALEAGVAIAAAYPGTPSSEIGNILHEIAKDAGIYFEFSTNEMVSMEVAGGAAISGARSLCFMKHVGLNVAADAFMSLAYTGVRGGLVIISADDPSCHSSQNEQDNRYYARIAGVPVLEPATPAECQEFVREGFEISEKYQMPVMVRTTTRVNHARGPIVLKPLQPGKKKATFERDPQRFVILPAVARLNHVRNIEAMDKLRQFSEESPFNHISGETKGARTGVVTSGISYTYVREALQELGAEIPVLKLGMSYPLPDKKLAEFMKPLEKVIVVEELEPLVEDALKVIAKDHGMALQVLGKATGHFSRLYEFSPDTVMAGLSKALGKPAPARKIYTHSVELPNRPPALCPACPHRAAYYAAKKAAGKDAVYSQDIGCYTLGAGPPLKAADFLFCMGSSLGAAGGVHRAVTNPVIAFIGDSTFFHAGFTGLANAIHNKHKFVICIVDNSTTAMTGHQPHPGLPVDGMGDAAPSISIEKVVRAMGVEFLETVDPWEVDKMTDAFKRALAHPGVAVVISKHPCIILEIRDRKKKGVAKQVYEVSQDECKKCHACINKLGCPAFFTKEKDVFITSAMCEGCGVCAHVCPAGAIKLRGEGKSKGA